MCLTHACSERIALGRPGPPMERRQCWSSSERSNPAPWERVSDPAQLGVNSASPAGDARERRRCCRERCSPWSPRARRRLGRSARQPGPWSAHQGRSGAHRGALARPMADDSGAFLQRHPLGSVEHARRLSLAPFPRPRGARARQTPGPLGSGSPVSWSARQELRNRSSAHR